MIDHPRLTATLKENLWRRDSLQFALYRDLLRYYDRPGSSPPTIFKKAAPTAVGRSVQLPELEDALRAACADEGLHDVQIDRRPVQNSLVVSLGSPSADDDHRDEGLLLYAVKKVVRTDGLEGRLCCAIRDFWLLEFGRTFKDDGIEVDVFLFGVEFATALAIFHDITMQGVLRYWLSAPEQLGFFDYQPPRRYVSKAMLQGRFDRNECIGLCIKSKRGEAARRRHLPESDRQGPRAGGRSDPGDRGGRRARRRTGVPAVTAAAPSRAASPWRVHSPSSPAEALRAPPGGLSAPEPHPAPTPPGA